MPGSTSGTGVIADVLAAIDTLPEIAGLAPLRWLAIVAVGALFLRFLIGNPAGGR